MARGSWRLKYAFTCRWWYDDLSLHAVTASTGNLHNKCKQLMTNAMTYSSSVVIVVSRGVCSREYSSSWRESHLTMRWQTTGLHSGTRDVHDTQHVHYFVSTRAPKDRWPSLSVGSTSAEDTDELDYGRYSLDCSTRAISRSYSCRILKDSSYVHITDTFTRTLWVIGIAFAVLLMAILVVFDSS